MSKAEDFAIKKYPVSIEDIHGHKVDVNLWQRKACVEGYHQAEKDNELTWQDTFDIFRLVNEVLDDYAEGKTKKEVGEEVLRRFKDLKNGTTKR